MGETRGTSFNKIYESILRSILIYSLELTERGFQETVSFEGHSAQAAFSNNSGATEVLE